MICVQAVARVREADPSVPPAKWLPPATCPAPSPMEVDDDGPSKAQTQSEPQTPSKDQTPSEPQTPLEPPTPSTPQTPLERQNPSTPLPPRGVVTVERTRSSLTCHVGMILLIVYCFKKMADALKK
jgi:hypothetical protein